MRQPTRRSGAALAAVTAAALAVGGIATHGEQIFEKLSGHDGDNESMSEFLHEHPQLNKRAQALAYVKEKSEQGGEAEGEILNGPASEEYQNRAYPRTAIGVAQQKNTAVAFGKAKGRAQLKPSPLGQWRELGPDGGAVPGDVTYTGQASNVGGRTTALAAAPGCSVTSCTLYAGTAGGGLWRTDNPYAAVPKWVNVSDDALPSTAIGSLTFASDGTLYVGTGEQNGSSDSESGMGLYRTSNGGKSFSKVTTTVAATDFTAGRAIGAVTVDPADPQHLLVGTDVGRHGASAVNGGRFTPPGAATLGLYESTDGGRTWTLTHSETGDSVNPASPSGGDFFRGGVSQVQVVKQGGHDYTFAAFDSYGLFRRLDRGSWTQVYATPGAGSAAISSVSRFAFAAVPKAGKIRVYLGDATLYNGSKSGLLRTDDAATVTPDGWTVLSSDHEENPAGFSSYNFCQGQCSYDIAVTADPAQPDEVFLSGSMNYGELFTAHQPSNGRAVVRSTDGGQSFTDMTNDVKNNGLHPDQHALLIVPGTAGTAHETFFSASDGGVVRQSGPYTDHSSDCDSRELSGTTLAQCHAWLAAIPASNAAINQTLRTFQFQSASFGPRGLIQGGTQDNGTWTNDGSRGINQSWFETVGGDGGQSGVDAGNSSIRYHSYYAPQHDVNFRGSDPRGWDWISDPLLESGEAASFYTPLTADPVVAGTIFDGLQHVWRTTDNGGARAILDKHCNEFTGDFTQACGDWVPVGGTAGDLSGGDASNYIVAITRSASDASTMWVATRKGGLFVSHNANASDPAAVTFTRIDTAAHLPNRFVSGIVLDPGNANRAWVSYSGYSAYAAGGHVYEVKATGATATVTATDLSGDLGDIPVTSIARSGAGVLFAATDYGVLVLNGGSWVPAGRGLPPVLTASLTYQNGTLVAATHGRGLWSLSAK